MEEQEAATAAPFQSMCDVPLKMLAHPRCLPRTATERSLPQRNNCCHRARHQDVHVLELHLLPKRFVHHHRVPAVVELRDEQEQTVGVADKQGRGQHPGKETVLASAPPGIEAIPAAAPPCPASLACYSSQAEARSRMHSLSTNVCQFVRSSTTCHRRLSTRPSGPSPSNLCGCVEEEATASPPPCSGAFSAIACNSTAVQLPAQAPQIAASPSPDAAHRHCPGQTARNTAVAHPPHTSDTYSCAPTGPFHRIRLWRSVGRTVKHADHGLPIQHRRKGQSGAATAEWHADSGLLRTEGVAAAVTIVPSVPACAATAGDILRCRATRSLLQRCSKQLQCLHQRLTVQSQPG